MALPKIRWEITYAGSFMGNIDASSRGRALAAAYKRWGGKKSLYRARQTIYLNPRKKSTAQKSSTEAKACGQKPEGTPFQNESCGFCLRSFSRHS